jgi:hypothetical protein
MDGIIITPMPPPGPPVADPTLASGASATSAAPAAPAAPSSDIALLLAPLGASERGFVLGLLLARGSQSQREDAVRVVWGPLGARCAEAIRRANALSRNGRLQLIRHLAGEALGTGAEGLDVFSFPDDRLGLSLTEESDEILGCLAAPVFGPDTLTAAATQELARRGNTLAIAPAPARDDLIDLRRALLSQLEG